MRLHRHSAGLVAAAAVAIAYGFAKSPEIGEDEREQLASRFRFTAMSLPESPSVDPARRIREVNPKFAPIAGWISAVGAAIALNDMDGDGLPNDACHVDPRADEITVSPVPGTGDRYPPVTLSPAPLPYDAAKMAPMGCLPVDVNEDGRLDLVAYYWGRTPIVFLRDGSGYRPVEIAQNVERWYTNAATAADLDGDGHLDLVFGNYFPDGARVLDTGASNDERMQHSMSRASNGGGLRFLLWTRATGSTSPTVAFREARDAMDSRHVHGWALAVGAADLDGDLLPDVYVANDFGSDHLLHNRSRPGEVRFVTLEGTRGFTTPRSKVLGRDSFKGMGVDFADLNGDGLLDIYVGNIAAEYALEESHFAFISTGRLSEMAEGRAPYVDQSESLGLSRSDWAWDSRWADLDNDGVFEALQATGFRKGTTNRWPELQELAMGNDELVQHPDFWFKMHDGDDISGHARNAFFVRGSDRRYHDLAAEVGLGTPHVTRGIALADVDGDGDLDFAEANQWEPSYFYRNECGRCGGFLGLRLLLPVSGNDEKFAIQPGRAPGVLGRPAIGASVSVTLAGGRQAVAQVDGGNGHSGKRSPDVHFGLGDVARSDELPVQIRWRSSTGVIRERRVSLAPGWHTVMLGD
jgi:enediyne biosynthesis protein E4